MPEGKTFWNPESPKSGTVPAGPARAEEVGASGGLAAKHVADPETADVADEPVEPGPAQVLEQRHVDRLRAVVVQLRGQARPEPRPAQVAVQLRQARLDVLRAGG